MKFRLDAGRPAAYQQAAGLPRAKADAPDTHPGMFYPNREPDWPLVCGCKIPWPVITLLGSGHGSDDPKKRQVQCDVHGWQRVSDETITKAKKGMKQCQNPNQTSLTYEPDESCPF